MRATTATATLVAMVSLVLLATPVLAQVAVTVQNPSFSWTGKEGQQANFRWSATIDNPSKRDVRVRMTLELLDEAGGVVSSDSTEIRLAKESDESIQRTGTIAFSEAQKAKQYRITLAGLEN